MKILVTGATGFLGSRLVREFLRKGHEVVILKRSCSDMRRIADIMPDLAAYDTDRHALDRIFREGGVINAVIHTATNYGRNGEGASAVLAANLLFPLRLLEAAAAARVAIFFNTDTSLHRELNAYALSKKQFAEWGKFFARLDRIRFVNLELEHFYGPGDDESKFTSYIMQSCLKNIPALKLTAGEQKRDFIHVDDVVAAYLLLLEKATEIEEEGDYQIGSGSAVTVRMFVEMVRAVTGSTTYLDFGAIPYRDNEVMESVADVRRLKELGWIPRVSLLEGLSRTAEEEKVSLGKI